MDDEEMRRRFELLVDARGAAYARARDELLAQGARLRPWLLVWEEDADWRPALTAKTLLGWLDDRERFDAVAGYLEGRVAPPPPAGLHPTSMGYSLAARVASVVEMGTAITPRLLEIVLREPPVHLDDEQHSEDALRQENARAALGRLRDEQSREPLADAVGDPSRPLWLRAACAEVLGGDLGDPRGAAFGRTLAWDEARTLEARVKGIGLLVGGATDEDRAALRALAADTGAAPRLRSTALTALRDLREPRLAALCASLLDEVTDEAMRIDLVGLIGVEGGVSALPTLQHVATSDPSEEVRLEARRTIARVERAERGA